MAQKARTIDHRLPPDLEEALAALSRLSTAELWSIARRPAPPEIANQLAELNDRRQREGLNADEERLADSLVEQLDQVMVRRAEAVALLHQRGEDVSALVARA